MLTPVADGVFVLRSELLRNLTVVVHGRAGPLVADPGITATELACFGRQCDRPEQVGWLWPITIADPQPHNDA